MNVSRTLGILLVTLVALTLAACGNDNDAGHNGTSIVATTAQIGALTQEVAGDDISIHVLMPPGVNPHDFHVTPDDLRTMGAADVILRNGLGLDTFLDGSIDAAGGDADIVTVTGGIEPISGGLEHHDEGEDHDHDDADPHVWHDPANARLMVNNIADALSTTDPDHAQSYRENAGAYNAVLDETDAKIRAMIDEIPAENRKLVTNHDAFGYFARAYGLEVVGAVIPGTSTNAEPSAQEIAALSELIEQEQVKAIFAESTVDPKVAEQLAQDTGVQIVYGLYSDSLGEPGTDAATVDGMLLANATKISEALK